MYAALQLRVLREITSVVELNYMRSFSFRLTFSAGDERYEGG